MKVVITDYQYDNVNAERRIVEDAGFELLDYQVKTPGALIPLVKDADAIITQYADIDRQVIESLEHCKMIIKYGIGVNNIDCRAAGEKGIYVCGIRPKPMSPALHSVKRFTGTIPPYPHLPRRKSS